VVELYGVLEDAEALWRAPIGAPQSDSEHRKDVLAAKRAKRRTERCVNGVTGIVQRERAVRRFRPFAGGGLSAGTRAFAAPRGREREGELAGALRGGEGELARALRGRGGAARSGSERGWHLIRL
jgi:hypothetical protein